MNKTLTIIAAMALAFSIPAFGQSSSSYADANGGQSYVSLPDGGAIITECTNTGDSISCTTDTWTAEQLAKRTQMRIDQHINDAANLKAADVHKSNLDKSLIIKDGTDPIKFYSQYADKEGASVAYNKCLKTAPTWMVDSTGTDLEGKQVWCLIQVSPSLK